MPFSPHFLSFRQEPPRPPAALGSLLQRLGRKASPGAPPTRFKPVGRPVLLPQMADAFGQDAGQRKAVRDLLLAGWKAVEEGLAKEGHANDAAAGLAFGIVVLWTVWSGKEPSDKASEVLLAQLHGALDTAEVRALSDAEKQKIHEYGVGVGVFVGAMKDEVGDDSQARAGLKAFAAQGLQAMLGVPPERLRLTDAGLSAAGGAPPAGGGPKALLTLSPPPGWTSTTDDGGVFVEKAVATQSKSGEPLRTRILIVTGAPQSGDPSVLVRSFYDRFLRPRIPDGAVAGGVRIKDGNPDVCRRLVGNGLRCHFAGVSWTKEEDGLDYFGTSQELHLYAVESAGRWVPVFVALSGMKGSPVGGGATLFGRVRDEWLEQGLSALRGTPSGKPLFTAAEMAGDYQLSSSVAGPFYYNAVTGASLGMGVSSRGHRLVLRGNGTYDSKFAGASGIGSAITVRQEAQSGPFRITQDRIGAFLVRRRKDGKDSPMRLVGHYRLPDGRRVLLTLPPGFAPTLPNVWATGDRYFTGGK